MKPEVAVTPVTSWAATVSTFHVTPSPVLIWPTGDLDIYKEVLGYECSESRVSHPLWLNIPSVILKAVTLRTWPLAHWSPLRTDWRWRFSTLSQPCRTRDMETLRGGGVLHWLPRGFWCRLKCENHLYRIVFLLEFETQSGKASGLNETQLLLVSLSGRDLERQFCWQNLLRFPNRVVFFSLVESSLHPETALGVGRGPCLTRGLLTNSSFPSNPQFSWVRISICMWWELPGGSARPNHHGVSQMFCMFTSRWLSLRKSEATSFPPACLPSAMVQKAPVNILFLALHIPSHSAWLIIWHASLSARGWTFHHRTQHPLLSSDIYLNSSSISP